MELILAACAGFLFGIITAIAVFMHKSAGKLHIVVDDQDGSNYMFLELSENVNKITSKKFATFEITQK